MANAINSLSYGDGVYPFTLPYGVCSTDATTAAKTVTVDNFSLETGATVIVRFYNSDGVSGASTLNVNGTGAKTMIYDNLSHAGNFLTYYKDWTEESIQMFTYDGTYWVAPTPKTYTNASLGQGYGTCSTAASTTAKVVSLSGYSLVTGGIVSVKFTYAVPASATMNINSTGAKSIYYSGAAITAGIIRAGDTATFIYYGGKYHLLAIDRCVDLSSVITADITKLSVAEGVNTTASGNYSHAEGWYAKASGGSAHAEGYNTKAEGDYSHAEGYTTTASGNYSHAEGYTTTASGSDSHAEGNSAIASGDNSHAEGYHTTASGLNSHAEGSYTTASGALSHAEGYKTTALAYQHAQGHFNNTTTATAGTSSGSGTGTAFVIGNGTSSSSSNAFRVTYQGAIYANNSITTSGRDYAEYFEWEDLNPNSEDRRGYFVTLDGDKIRIAKPGDYILGIISGQPSVIGNGDEDWKGRYILDDFGSYIIEEFEYDEEEPVEVIDEETGETKIEIKTTKKIGTKYKENPDYDATLPYIQREDRPEWDAVGMLGVLSVRDDGTCKVNGFCKVAEGGIATASDDGYRVVKRVSDNVVKVIIK